MAFRYSFQKIVDLKATEKTQAQWYLSSAIGDLNVEEASLSTLYSEQGELQHKLANESAACVTVSQLMVYQHYLDHIEQRIASKHHDVITAQQQVVNCQEVLTAKVVEEEKWAQAKDKAKLAFHTGMLKKEQEEIDEISITRHKVMR